MGNGCCRLGGERKKLTNLPSNPTAWGGDPCFEYFYRPPWQTGGTPSRSSEVAFEPIGLLCLRKGVGVVHFHPEGSCIPPLPHPRPHTHPGSPPRFWSRSGWHGSWVRSWRATPGLRGRPPPAAVRRTGPSGGGGFFFRGMEEGPAHGLGWDLTPVRTCYLSSPERARTRGSGPSGTSPKPQRTPRRISTMVSNVVDLKNFFSVLDLFPMVLNKVGLKDFFGGFRREPQIFCPINSPVRISFGS